MKNNDSNETVEIAPVFLPVPAVAEQYRQHALLTPNRGIRSKKSSVLGSTLRKVDPLVIDDVSSPMRPVCEQAIFEQVVLSNDHSKSKPLYNPPISKNASIGSDIADNVIEAMYKNPSIKMVDTLAMQKQQGLVARSSLET